MNKLTILIIFGILKLFTCEEHDDECEKVIEEHGSPYECCNLPFTDFNNTPAAGCDDLAMDYCKHYECYIEKLNLIENGKVNDKNVAEMFLKSLDNLNVPRENWTKVVEESVKSCESRSEPVFLLIFLNFCVKI